MEHSTREKLELVRDNFDRAAAAYDDSPYFPICGRMLVDLAQLQPGFRVLDVATGTGAVLFHAVERIGLAGHVTGIDFAEHMVTTTANEIARRGLANADVRQMDAQHLEFGDASFDCVLCGFALWFIPDLPGALKEMRRVLRPGGRIAVSTWGTRDDALERYNELLKAHGAAIPNLSSHSLTSAEALTTVLQAAGFEVLHAAAQDVTIVFADEEQWWAQRMSNFQLNANELAPSDRARFQQDVYATLQTLKRSDGIHQTRSAVFAVATSP